MIYSSSPCVFPWNWQAFKERKKERKGTPSLAILQFGHHFKNERDEIVN
jgi:hypothetical protein